MAALRIVAAGDSAVTAEFPHRIAPEINARVLALASGIRRRCAGSIRDIVIGYCTVTVFFDPLTVDALWIEGEMRDALAELPDRSEVESAVIDVPVCYGGDLGPDLDDVAAFGGCSREEVVALHVAATYRVYLLGFVPGFAYMAEVDARIAAPRRPSPRSAVPAGSVAIAGGQTAIYPSVTPGGWNIIGRTPVKPYDPSRAVPFLFQPGDRVRFRAITRAEFERRA
jgi:KipI family sensor histidine kinase inhibitor